MSSLEPRGGRYTSRSAKERRGYQLVVVGGVAGLVAVVGIVLAIAGAVGAGIPLIAAVVAVLCWVWFRRLVSRSR